MKNLFLIAVIVLGFSAVSFGQSSDVATASATLITPISILKTVDMVFGTVASSNTDGTVVLSNSGTVATATGGASLVLGGSTRSVAEFNVTGEGASTFSVSCPTEITLLGATTSNTLVVNSIATNTGTTGTLATGVFTIKVQGTLVLPALSVSDVYSNAADLKVTVNYN